MIVLIANIIDFAAAMLQIYAGTVQKKNRILGLQTCQLGMQTVSMLLLGGITGAISNVLSCVRNIVCYKDALNKWWKAALIAVQLLMTISFNVQGAIGWLPFVVCTVFILFMDTKDPVKFKLLVTVSYAPWVVYYLVIRSYTGAFFAAATVCTNAVSLYSMLKKSKEQ